MNDNGRQKQGASSSSIAINKQLPIDSVVASGGHRSVSPSVSQTVNTFFETQNRRGERALHGI